MNTEIHSYQQVIQQATCAQIGCTRHICNICGREYQDNLKPALDHNLIYEEPKQATMNSTGNIEYWHCKDCAQCFADEGGKIKLSLDEIKTPSLNTSETIAPINSENPKEDIVGTLPNTFASNDKTYLLKIFLFLTTVTLYFYLLKRKIAN